MRTKNTFIRGLWLCGLMGISGLACEFEHPSQPPVNPPPREVPDAVAISGHTFDPEYYFLSLVYCADPEECPPPLLFKNFPHYEASLVPKAHVSVVTPAGTSEYAALSTTGASGAWNVFGVPRDLDEGLYLHAEVDPDLELGEDEHPFPRDWNPEMPPLPEHMAYLPTTTAMPIVPNYTACYSRSAFLVSNVGALKAVANFLSERSQTPVTVEDLLDPTQYGGVLVWWNMLPEWSLVRVPGFGTETTTDVGRTLMVTWAPPDELPPELGQSEMGFFALDPEEEPLDPEMSIGLTVTLLPPGAASTEVTVTINDPFESEEEGRPWHYGEPRTVLVRPGHVTYAEGQVIEPDFELPASELCLAR